MGKGKIFIVDEDALSAALAAELLADVGFETRVIDLPSRVTAELKENVPDALLLDIMLAGQNGLKVLDAIRKDEALSAVKIIVTSQKNYEFDKLSAFRLGADAFITKPYNVDNFARLVSDIMTGEFDKFAAVKKEQKKSEIMPFENKDVSEDKVKISFYGVRGLSEVVPNSKSRIGRQTSCVAVETKKELFILDAGTGIIPLGKDILKRGGPKTIWILLTHLHLDHVLGLTRFPCLAKENFTVKIGGPAQPSSKFRHTITDMFFENPMWGARAPSAEVLAYEFGEDTYKISDDVSVSALFVNHPGTALCYKLDVLGRKIIYAPDNELGDAEQMDGLFAEKFAKFCEEADIFIHDATYTDEDYALNAGGGHSSHTMTADFALDRIDCPNIALFHFDGKYPDEVIETMLSKTKAKAEPVGVRVLDVKEGFSIIL